LPFLLIPIIDASGEMAAASVTYDAKCQQKSLRLSCSVQSDISARLDQTLEITSLSIF